MKHLTLLALAPAFVLAACSDSTTGRLSLSLTTRPAVAPAPSAAFASGMAAPAPGITASGDSTMITLGSDSVIVRSVEVVLRKVELKRADVAACDDIPGNDDCEEFETGATLVSLPLGSMALAQQVSVTVPPGMFDELELQIHKPTNSEDAAFIAAHPSFAGVSIRVTGTYSQAGSRSDFTFTSDVNQSQEMSLSSPVTVQEGQTLNVTLRVDIASWFLNGTGTALVDPASANKGQPNEGLVANNIQNSFDAFEDDDHDGLDD